MPWTYYHKKAVVQKAGKFTHAKSGYDVFWPRGHKWFKSKKKAIAFAKRKSK